MGKRTEWPPVARPHAASGQMRVRWEGHDYYLGPIDSAEAREGYVSLIRKLGLARGAAARVPDSGPTVWLALAKWHAHALEKYGPANPEVRCFEDSFVQLRAGHGDTPAADFDADALEGVRDAMVAAKLCRNVVNKRVGRIKTVWRWLERKKLVPRGAWAGLRALEPLARGQGGVRESPKVRPAEWRDVAAICRGVAPEVRGLLLAQWFTGARPGELFRLRVGEIVAGSGLGEAEREEHKNARHGHQRTLTFGPRALKAVRPFVEGKGPDDLVFPNRDGRPFNRNSYRLAVVRAAERVGADKVAPYRLRHAFKRRVTRELGIESARAILGQSSILMTDRYAAGGDQQLAQDAAKRCG